jgi:hypothetical protein
MSNPVFNPDSQSLISIPKGVNCGTCRATGSQRSIPLAPLGDTLMTANSFGQVQAVRDEPKQTCMNPSGAVAVCNGFTRVSLWLTRMVQPLASDDAYANTPLLTAGVQVPATPPAFDVQLRWATGNISETLFQGTYTPAAWTDHGLLVEVSGVQADQIELWARIPNPSPAATLSFSVFLQWQLTVHGGNSTVPVVGNNMFIKGIQQYV